MSKPKAPTPPDPQETAAAQTGQNVGTSIANTVMGQVNQVGPDGSLTYDQTGTYAWRDPNSGQVYQLPQYTATTTLSEDAQQLRDLNNESSIALGTLGRDAANRAGSILGEDFNIDGVTARADRSGMGPVEYGSGPMAPELMADGRSLPTLDGFSGDAGLATGYENDFSAKQQEMEDMLFSQLDEQRGKDLEALRSQLYGQGVVEGSEQYSRAMEDFDRSVDDRRLAAMREGLGFTQAMTGMARDEAAFGNQARQQGFTNDMTNTQLNNQNAQTLFGLGSDQLAYNNNIAQQNFGNEGIVTDRANANANANFNEARILADDADRVRAQEIDEAAWLRNQPINEIAALMSGSQVQTPQFAMAQPYAMPTTDIAGITQQGFGNQMANYQQQNANWQAMMGGLFGLGSAGIMRPGGSG